MVPQGAAAFLPLCGMPMPEAFLLLAVCPVAAMQVISSPVESGGIPTAAPRYSTGLVASFAEASVAFYTEVDLFRHREAG